MNSTVVHTYTSANFDGYLFGSGLFSFAGPPDGASTTTVTFTGTENDILQTSFVIDDVSFFVSS